MCLGGLVGVRSPSLRRGGENGWRVWKGGTEGGLQSGCKTNTYIMKNKSSQARTVRWDGHMGKLLVRL